MSKFALLVAALSICLTQAAEAELPAITPAYAESGNGAQLLTKCRYDESGCLNYVTGVQEGFAVAAAAQGVRFFCPPANVTPMQIGALTKNYLERHKKDLARRSGFFVLAAVKEAFPCSSEEASQ